MENAVTPADRAWGAFSDNPPWILDRDNVRWRGLVEGLRAQARTELPSLMAAPRVPPVRRLVVVVYTLGKALAPWWWKRRRKKYASPEASRADLSLRMRHAIERLGSTYIKLAQIISSGEGLFPTELVEEFKRCRDQVPAESFDDVRLVVEGDLGARIEDVFASFSTTPIAAASIAQVHAAVLRTGESVVVKVQRPQVGVLVRKDLKVMAWLAPFLVGRIKVAALANPPALVELFAETIVEELDFRIDTVSVIRTGMIAFMEGALLYGVFHGDLHGGNLFVMRDGRTALLDFGIVGRLTGIRRMAFLRLMLSATTNDVKGQISALRDLGALPMDTDIDAVIKDLRLDQATIDPTTLSGEQLVQEVQRVVKALLAYGARMPKELMLYVKNMVFLDGAIARLAPDLDLLGEIANISMLFAQRHGEQLGRELGIDPNQVEINLDSVKAGLGVGSDVNSMTYRDLQKRREIIQKRMRDHVAR